MNIEDVFRTVLIKEKFILSEFQTGAGKAKKIDWSKLGLYVQPYIKQIVYEIEQLNPFLIVTLGELGLHYLTGNTSLQKFRGSILLTQPELGIFPAIKVLPIMSPLLLMKDYKMNMITKQVDYGKIPKYLNRNPPPENLIRPWVATTAAEFGAFVNDLIPLVRLLTSIGKRSPEYPYVLHSRLMGSKPVVRLSWNVLSHLRKE